MAALRGSTQTLLGILEVTPGVTPATPAMREMPIVSFSPRGSYNTIRSNTIRGNPFPDKILNGSRTWEFGIEWELGRDHDLLLELFMGAGFASDELKFTDALRTMSLEQRAGAGSSLFDHFLGSHLTTLSIAVEANATSPITCTANGRAFTATLDDAATIASSVVPAGNNDPFIFVHAGAEIGGVATKIVSATINLERTVNPLFEVGDDDPSEYVPDLCTATGTMTIAYRDGTQSAIFENFENVSQEYVFGSADGAFSRTLVLPETKYVSFGRATQGRGVRMQEINWEAQYNAASGTIATFLRDETA